MTPGRGRRLRRTDRRLCLPGLAAARRPARIFSLPALVFGAAALLVAVSGGAEAACGGRDLLPVIKAQAPVAAAAMEARAQATLWRRGRLFRLSRDGLEPSYLFGTLHLADPRVTRFSAPMVKALGGSRVLVLELGLAAKGGAKPPALDRNRLIAAAGRRSTDLLSPGDVEQLGRLAVERALPADAARSFSAAALALMLDLPRCATPGEAAPYADLLLARMAEESGIAVKGLESLDDQIEALGGLPIEAEGALLVATIRQAARAEDVVETSIARYGEGDLGGLLAWMQSDDPIPGIPDARLPAIFVEKLLDARSRRMRDRVLPYLERGRAFVAVGAAHLPGSNGLLSYLADSGYRVDMLE